MSERLADRIDHTPGEVIPSFEAYGGTAAENYERHFVPAIGAPLAVKLVEIAALTTGERVLDVACGTGVVARLAAEKVSATGLVTGLDINPGMLAIAQSVSSDHTILDWHESAAEATGLPDAGYDAALCQMGLQFFADRHAALGEIRRVLAPGGRLVASVPGPTPSVFQILERALRDHVSPDAAKFVTAVFSLHEPPELKLLLMDAGFNDIAVIRETAALRLPAPAEFLWQYVSSTPLASVVASLRGPAREALKRDVVRQWQTFIQNGAFILDLEVVYVTANTG